MTLDQKILELVKKYMGKLAQKKVLTSMEEVEANTNETNLVGAPVVAELNNKLAGFEPVLDSTGKITGYKTNIGGADTVFPFSSDNFVYVPWGQSIPQGTSARLDLAAYIPAGKKLNASKIYPHISVIKTIGYAVTPERNIIPSITLSGTTITVTFNGIPTNLSFNATIAGIILNFS